MATEFSENALELARRTQREKTLEGCRKALKRMEAQSRMYGATPTNGLEFWEASAMYHASLAAEASIKARIFDIEEELGR